jgi:hypothetical protein
VSRCVTDGELTEAAELLGGELRRSFQGHAAVDPEIELFLA